jgi:integrase
MASSYIVTRTTKKGRRFAVRYRLGGRESPVQAGGTFGTMREARIRRDLIAGELAAGRNPTEVLALAQPPKVRTLASWYASWLRSRVDVSERTLVNLGLHWKRIEPSFGDRDPSTIARADVQDWINDQMGTLSPAALRDYLGTLRQLLDYAEVEPNPARNRLLQLPARERQVPVPPTDKHVLAMLEHMPSERRLFFAFLEQDGGRLGEHIAFTWGDVDVDGARILARPEAIKGRRGRRKPRWLQVPAWLLDLLLDTCPPEDRVGDRPLFPWLQRVEHPEPSAWKTMRQACKAAGIPHYHPHDLRHRRLSLWHGQGIPAREIAERVGHSKPSMSLDVYTHVMPLDEVPQEAYRRVLVVSGWCPGAAG